MGALALVTLAACTTPGTLKPLPPPPSVPQTTSTTAVDFSGVALKAAAGRTTTTVAVQPGSAALSGTVVGPGGPVEGAMVRAERLVGEGVGSMDVLTGADGTYAMAGILGGRYRVRAWKPSPDNLAMVSPEVFFLEGRESKVLNLTIARFQGIGVTSAIAPSPPVIEDLANLVVQVVDRLVDQNGIVRATPVDAFRVELFGAGDWRIRSANPMLTDGSGRAVFTVECRRAGAQPLSVVVGEATTFPLELPPCAVPVDESDAATSTTAAAGGGAATTTTTAARSSTTTTTARPASTTTTAR